MNKTIQAILSRRSIRAYAELPVPAQLLDTILTCGIYAPSGQNRQEIILSAITNRPLIEQLRMMVWQEFLKMEPEDEQYMNIAIRNAHTKRDYDFTFHAPVLIIASGPENRPNGMAESALSLGNVMLAAASLGLGSCYVNQLHWLEKNASIRAFLSNLGIPADESIYGSLVLGYPDAPHRDAAPRKDGRIRILG